MFSFLWSFFLELYRRLALLLTRVFFSSSLHNVDFLRSMITFAKSLLCTKVIIVAELEAFLEPLGLVLGRLGSLLGDLEAWAVLRRLGVDLDGQEAVLIVLGTL